MSIREAKERQALKERMEQLEARLAELEQKFANRPKPGPKPKKPKVELKSA